MESPIAQEISVIDEAGSSHDWDWTRSDRTSSWSNSRSDSMRCGPPASKRKGPRRRPVNSPRRGIAVSKRVYPIWDHFHRRTHRNVLDSVETVGADCLTAGGGIGEEGTNMRRLVAGEAKRAGKLVSPRNSPSSECP